MCRMTHLGTRWKVAIEMPGFGETQVWWAVKYNNETRYTPAPDAWREPEARKWLRPMYAVRVKARDI